jgi:DNA polymerase
MSGHGTGGGATRAFEAYLVALREALGDEVVVDPAGTVRFAPDPVASSAVAERPASRPDGARAGAPGAGEARDRAAPAGPVTARSSAAASWSSPAGRGAVSGKPAAAPPAPAAPQQTSLLKDEPLVLPTAPAPRKAPAAPDPGVVVFRGPSPIVRGPCRAEVRAEALAELDRQVRGCTKCRLHERRTNTVFGVGAPCARVCFVGEGPGAEEDKRGEPFVGRAGQLLDKIVSAMKLRRTDVYICNTVKCRPPENRTPYPDELEACGPYLCGQLEAVAPQVIVALGRPAANTLLGVNTSVGELRGRFHLHREIPVRVTYHPAYLLRNPDAKKQTWEDVQHVMQLLAEHPDPMSLSGGGGG